MNGNPWGRTRLPFDAEDNIFLLPGPVKIHPKILRAMMVPAVAHRSSSFKAVIRDVGKGLQYLFDTKGRVCAMTGSATLAMEAAVSNLIRRGDRIVVLVNGKFGERFVDIAKRYSPEGTHVIASPMGTGPNLAELAKALAAGGVKAVAAVLNESSTGVRAPGAAIAELCAKYDAFLIADGVTGVGGMEVPVDKWGVDVCIAGSQKCLGAPPGLSFVAVSEAAYGELKSPSLYLDLKLHLDKWAEEETPFTPATHLLLATRAALDLLVEETLAKRIERTQRLAAAFRAGIGALRLPLLCDASVASSTVTAVAYPTGLSDEHIREPLRRDHGFVVAGGQGELKGKIFRVGHMGFAQPRELAALLVALEDLLARAKHTVTPGAATTAFFKAWT